MTFDQAKPFITSAVRHGLTLVAGVLVAHGAVSPTYTGGIVESLSGVLVGLIGFAWSQIKVARVVAAVNAIPISAIEVLAGAIAAAHKSGDGTMVSDLSAALASATAPMLLDQPAPVDPVAPPAPRVPVDRFATPPAAPSPGVGSTLGGQPVPLNPNVQSAIDLGPPIMAPMTGSYSNSQTKEV